MIWSAPLEERHQVVDLAHAGVWTSVSIADASSSEAGGCSRLTTPRLLDVRSVAAASFRTRDDLALYPTSIGP